MKRGLKILKCRVLDSEMQEGTRGRVITGTKRQLMKTKTKNRGE